MSSCIGNVLRLSVFGQSHAAAVGCTLDGVPAGYPIDLDELQRFLDRRAPGRDATATSRNEADKVRIVSGIVDGYTCGAPIAGVIVNDDTRSVDYEELGRIPRPGHADYTAFIKYRGHHDVAGGGHFSGRLTAPLCIAGGIAKQVLARHGVRIAAHISALGPRPVVDEPLDAMHIVPKQIDSIRSNSLPCIDPDAASAMRDTISHAKLSLDSVGGTVECVAYGMPAGIGDPMFDGIENRIARIAFGIPAVKGVEFGDGFASARRYGSEHNDPYHLVDGSAQPMSNNAGGILGGITTGLPIVWNMSIKPTPSIGRKQASVDLVEGHETVLSIRGRHDPCIVPRAVPVAEAVCALALLDALLEDATPVMPPLEA